MSGDVQPRKRKDKRRKKEELGVEEPRGTAAVFGEGDVLMHSHHDHGTGGHWCAKIIFFSLLAVLITLIGLIILENRGLSELEANAVESRYSGVLDGWIEDAHDDDHHDEHTLDLKHQSYEDIHEENDIELDHEDDKDDDEEGHSDEVDDEENEDDEDIADSNVSEEQDEHDLGDDDDDNSEEQENQDDDDADDDIEDNDEDERDVEDVKFDKYDDDDDNDDDENDDDEDEIDEKDSENVHDLERDDEGSEEDIDDDRDEEPNANDNDDEENTSIEQDFNENDENIDSKEKESKEDVEQDEEDDDESDEEIEKIEKEVVDEEEQAVSYEDNDSVEKDDQDDEENDKEDEIESPSEEDISVPPVVEPIIAPKGKPFVELDDESSPDKPTDTLAEEEEYERRQEELRQQKQESLSQMWLKLVVGGALLVATHAVIRRSTAPRDTPEVEDNATREDTPSLVDRRMTLIPQETAPLLPQEAYEPVNIREEPIKKIVSEAKTVQSAPISKHESDEEEDEETPDLIETEVIPDKGSNDRDKELYSDDEDAEDEQESVEEGKETEEKVEKDEEEDVADDVEIIDDEQIDEQIEEEIEEEDEEEISDVDDAELLSRLEAKYGRLPEPERPEKKHKDGGNSAEDEWPGEPSEQFWRQQLEQAEREIRQGEWTAANGRLAAPELANSGRARWLLARSLDAQAEAKRDNALLSRAISAYLQVLKMYESLSDTKLREVAARALDRIQFRGNYLSAEPVYRLLIRRFPSEVSYRNNLTISFLMANRADLASDVLKETLKLWPEDRIALAHYGFVLKTNFNKIEESVAFFQKALENDEGPACEPRFYYHLGDALLLLNRFDEAHEIHKRGAKHGHFLSPSQRSLYNVERLKSRPWWRIEETPYTKLANALEKQWKDILKEGEAAKALYEKEKEGLKEKGEWSQLDIFVRGQEIPGRCKRAPVTCSIVKAEMAAANCRRGQIKFSSMEPGTHVRPHVGPTNCRLRMHLGLSNTKDTYIRVDQEIRQWQTGKVLLFDDSFEHEVWHNGTGTRLVLIVDVWHPDLTAKERRQLPAI